MRWLTACLVFLVSLWGMTPAAAATGRLPQGVTPVSYDIKVIPDATRLTFTGEETITIEVSRPVSAITLNAAELDIGLALLDGAISGQVVTDKAAQTLTVRFANPVTAGRHTLKLSWTGKINQSAAGLFAVDYKTLDGKDARMLVTQFEAPDARRFAPMWDEPAYKATFKLSVVTPPNQTAFSNMPANSKEMTTQGALWRFAETPQMSSYLLFMGMGEIDRKTVQAGDVEIGVITRKGVADQGDYALESAKRLLAYYNDYFGTPYPLPKLDMIAAPGSSQFFSAMENWGAILYFEPTLLLDPRLETEGQRQDVFGTVAHEIAHQWFGNLVTMAWWDDLWLNEGYASWMASKAADDLNPEWKSRAQAVSGGKQSAMALDARASTHPIIQKIATVEQIAQAFDAITYRKGEAVIRMLEDHVGADGFRKGVRAYMAKHAYGNTVTEDLWMEIATASGKPVAPMMRSFTRQGGVPLIRVGVPRCEAGKTRLTLAQGRFGLDAVSRAARTWMVPVRLSAERVVKDVMVSGARAMPVTIDGCDPVIVNASQAAYFRTLYTPAHRETLVRTLAALPVEDQLGLATDAYALAAGGNQDFAPFLDLVAATPTDASPLLWAYLVKQLDAIDSLLDGDSSQAVFRARTLRILKPLFARTGWEPRAGEASALALLREVLIPALGTMGDPEIGAEARRLADASLAGSDLPGSVRQAALAISAYRADAALWDALLARARAETSPVAKQELYGLLGFAGDPLLVGKTLDLALSNEATQPIRTGMIAAASARHADRVFDWAVTHANAVNAQVEASSKSSFIPGLASESTNPETAAKVRTYAQKALAADARADAQTVISRIAYTTGLRQRLVPAIQAWEKAR